ncbi:MAG: cbb3-type cytochrome oxidase assembly protein CcoS [Sulfurospirillum sp.]|jgi:cbb3-type cytochrome oxidase maturation protein|nr:cbb3-type cytochrome oxidase assembly protein CcoS [Sulfurospirillum sp.]
MDGWLIAMMIGASTLLGAFGLWGLMWGIKSGQFDDHQKFLDGAQFDSEEALQDAVMMEKKKEEAKKKMGYAPPD